MAIITGGTGGRFSICKIRVGVYSGSLSPTYARTPGIPRRTADVPSQDAVPKPSSIPTAIPHQVFDPYRYCSNVFRAKASASISPCRPSTCLVLRR